MKHISTNSKLLNINKKWHHLHCRQREWVLNKLREEYTSVLINNGQHPNSAQCQKIVNRVYEQIVAREIWIPYEEVAKAFTSKLMRYRKIEI